MIPTAPFVLGLSQLFIQWIASAAGEGSGVPSPVRAHSVATGLSTPDPSGNLVLRNTFLTRLRRGDCAHHLSSTDSESVCQHDPSAPLLSTLLAFGPTLRPRLRPPAPLRGGAEESQTKIRPPAPLAQEKRQKESPRLLQPAPYRLPSATTACYKLSAAASASNSLKISGC
jgi:hypothetical protein